MTVSQTIPDIVPRIEYAATAGQTVFTVPFPFFDDFDLYVYVAGVKQTLGTHYTVTGAGTTEGGTITFSTALTAGLTVVIRRLLVLERVTDFPLSGPFDIDELNRELDRIVAMIQQLQEEVDRTLQLDPTVSILEAGWDAKGRRIINVGYPINGSDAATLNTVYNNSGGGGGTGGTGGSGDLTNYYTKAEVDFFLAQLEAAVTADYQGQIDAITASVNAQVAGLLANSYRIRGLLKYGVSGQFNKADYPWLKGIRVICTGGGGGGGFAKRVTAGTMASGGGGGGGATVVTAIIPLADIPAGLLAVTVGAGGAGGHATGETASTQGQTSSVAGICSAEGGYPGFRHNVTGSTPIDTRGGMGNVGGSATTGGFFDIPGGYGFPGWVMAENGNPNGTGGGGGGSALGAGGRFNGQGGDENGFAPTGRGGGGGGGITSATVSSSNGADGGAGLVIIELYE